MRRFVVLPPVLLVLLLGFFALADDDKGLVAVSNIRMGVDDKGQTRLVLDLDRRPDFLVVPDDTKGVQLVVGLEGGVFAMDGGSGFKTGTGLVRRADFAPGQLRITLEEFALPSRSFVLPPAGDIDHFRLVIDLDKAAGETFTKAAADARALAEPEEVEEPAAAEVRAEAPAEPVQTASVRRILPPSLKPARTVRDDRRSDFPSLAELPAPREVLPAKTRPLIVLDPGHGGHDAGAVGQKGSLEDTVTLAFSQDLAKVLRRRGYDVLLTRNDDTYVKHDERIGFARTKGADLFMSIHADSHEDHSLRGASVYTLSARRSEKLENDIRREGNFVLFDVEVSNEDGVGDILLDLAQSATRQNSDRLADSLVKNMRREMPLLKNPKRRGALLVLLSPDVPAVLVELAFLSNSRDEANLTSPAWRGRSVAAIADGVDAYFLETGVEQRLAGGGGSGL
ncbi:N-acetylmuramoyl-L-alanine amidase family protein [Parvularcula maris]|uniref:N-acetylmuramoyl-L-alanine amidase n=1 Tax=Parvularcula maris TaxID=2965077 RepID=A0A9X2RJZ6_9PROT|nr:N-acetylmuramoyl-L-alanine amidase [Parvularcula maris]MCQ8185102.1 N-acetylmuramoyl-L-alanine amidase [Parvularcula maris]